MTIEEHRLKAIKLIDEQMHELSRIMHQASKDYEYDVGEKRLRSWKTATVKIIAENIHPEEGEKLLRKHANDSGSKRTQEVVEENVRLYRNFLLNVKNSLRNRSQDIFSPVILEKSLKRREAAPEINSEGIRTSAFTPLQEFNDQKIFIVFGQDELNSLRLEKLLRGNGFNNLLLLNTLSSKDQYLIEKLEQGARWDSCAIFFFTSGDFVRKTNSKTQFVRPELLFGLGWFCGKFGHQRVFLLSKKGAKFPSALANFVNIEFEDSVTNISETLEKALRDIGFDLSLPENH